jgi:WD40 repeat protein
MESITSTSKFQNLNFNLKKIIFSYVNPHDQRTIYWINKKLRPLLPDSPMRINIDYLKKCRNYQSDYDAESILQLSDGNISFWNWYEIKLLKLVADNLVVIKILPIGSENIYARPMLLQNAYSHPIQLQNENIIYASDSKKLTICDKDFNVIEILEETKLIMSICNLSELSFAVGFENGNIKIYSRNPESLKYEVVKENVCQYVYASSLLYLPKQNYLLSGSLWNKSIIVLNLSDLKTIQKLTGHISEVTSFLSLNDETFASGSYGEFKIWSIKADSSIQCIQTIPAHENCTNRIVLYNFVNDLMISRSGEEFKIWDWKTYECLGRYGEDCPIIALIVTKNLHIITGTNKKNVNLWKVLV